ncbi:RelA/SpoT domain-containing protein [Pseudomonas cedrina]|uniref:RelA/SpoT domain-containing protein n=1 Tax=Pseudomonas cedrina TaxID=651740 RepID=UPI003ED90760
MDRESFLKQNRITEADWQSASIDWDLLLAIHKDHMSRVRELEDTADFFVKSMQGFYGVHSVRWRVKSPDHLIEKIIRKRVSDSQSNKYREVSLSNYHQIVSDLIGVRALHLFKDGCLEIHDQIVEMWEPAESPVSYIRDGDRSELLEYFEERNISAKIHPAGYRSVHYVLKTKPGLREVLVEVQVRTVFEEAWSEIDHKVRYPNFSDNKQLENVLKIFNRLAGSADEMGGFIRDLSCEFDEIDGRISKSDLERDEALDEMQKVVSELASAKQTGAGYAEKIELLQKELDKVKSAIDVGSHSTGDENSPRVYVVGGKKYIVTGEPTKRLVHRTPIKQS